MSLVLRRCPELVEGVNEMGGKLLRSIGLERAKTNLGLRNLVYNLKRYVYLESRAAGAIAR